MNNTPAAGQNPHITIDRLKRAAKRIKKAEGIQHSKALDRAAQEAGYSNFVHARRQLTARATQ